MTRKALIFGIGGQDGSYLAHLLLAKGYEVSGTSRRATKASNLVRLGISNEINLCCIDPVDFEQVRALIAGLLPDEIYYLASQSSVARSFTAPGETFLSGALGVLNVIEAVKGTGRPIRTFNAASGDCFGLSEVPISERSAFAPRSPYAAAKCAGHHAVAVSRISHGQFACSGYLFGHESSLPREQFAVGKARAAALRIAAGSGEKLSLDNVEVVRDWGWAPDYVVAIWQMLQRDEPEDLVIATGHSHRLADLVERLFAEVGLNWMEHTDIGRGLSRASDIPVQRADPQLARSRLGWTATTDLDRLARLLMVEEEETRALGELFS